MKQITVKKCGKCPFCGYKTGYFYCKKISESFQNEVKFDTIHPDCPLSSRPTREEAYQIIAHFRAITCKEDIETLLTELGFGKE